MMVKFKNRVCRPAGLGVQRGQQANAIGFRDKLTN